MGDPGNIVDGSDAHFDEYQVGAKVRVGVPKGCFQALAVFHANGAGVAATFADLRQVDLGSLWTAGRRWTRMLHYPG